MPKVLRNKKKKNTKFYIYVLFGMVITLTILITVHQLTPAGLTLFFPNPAPQVIPGLREWQGGTGTFTMGMTSRITVDPAYATQLQETAQVFRDQRVMPLPKLLRDRGGVRPAGSDDRLVGVDRSSLRSRELGSRVGRSCRCPAACG